MGARGRSSTVAIAAVDWIDYAARSRSRFRATTARRSAKTEIVYTGAGRCWSDKIPIPIPIFNFQKKNRQINIFRILTPMLEQHGRAEPRAAFLLLSIAKIAYFLLIVSVILPKK